MQLYSDAGGSVSAPALPADVGKLTLAERFLEGFQLLKAAEKDIGHECLARMQALLYVFAGKFLNKDDLKKVKGVISMTILGEMLVKDGLDQGIRQGEEKLGRLIQLLIQNSRSDEISRGGNGPAVSGSVISGIWSVKKCIRIYDIPWPV